MASTTTPHGSDKDIPWVDTIAAAVGFGFIGIVIYAISQRSWLVFACALLLALAAVVAGGLGGFIFGIPKTVVSASGASVTATAEYTGNSNLEQISDWLTKILVGAGLVQLGEIRNQFAKFGAYLQDSKALGSAGGVVGQSIIIAYAVCGFLLAYLWARIYMAKALSGENAEAVSAHVNADGSAEATAGGATAT